MVSLWQFGYNLPRRIHPRENRCGSENREPRQAQTGISGRFPDKFDDFLAKLKSEKTVRAKYYATDPIFDEIGVNLQVCRSGIKFPGTE